MLTSHYEDKEREGGEAGSRQLLGLASQSALHNCSCLPLLHFFSLRVLLETDGAPG